MKDRPVKHAGSSRLSLLAGLALLFVPFSSQADTGNLRLTAAAEPAAVSMVDSAARERTMEQKAADNVMVRYGGISLSVDYGAGEGVDSLREGVGLQSPVRETAGLDNLIFKVGITF